MKRHRLRSVEVVRLEPGDHIVVEYEGPMTKADIHDIAKQVEDRFPGYPVTVLNRVSLKVVRPS